MSTAHTLLAQALAAYDAADANWKPAEWFESVRACLAAEPLSPAWCASIDKELTATEAADSILSAALLAEAQDAGARFDGASLEQAS